MPPITLPLIENLDFTYALQGERTPEELSAALAQFCREAPREAADLNEWYRKLPVPEGEVSALEEYRALARIMKEQAGGIGALTLMSFTGVLEDAAAGGRRDLIDRVHPVLIELWNEQLRRIREMIYEESKDVPQVEKPPRPELPDPEVFRTP
ncbi:MAG: hypothetical protein IKS07_11380 [Lachnospiraceae bacterium]|nr:hypothetical protein [Lachnospiraceae bacterium]